jgi:DNA polymerase-3 subunit gamma/tau
MLSKGIAEVNAHARPVQAAEMVLVRLAYAADLPTPDEALRKLAELSAQGGAAPAPPPGNGNGARAQRFGVVAGAAPMAAPVAAMPASPAEPTMALESFEDMVALAGSRRDILLKTQLEQGVRLVSFQDGRLEIALAGASPSIIAELGEKLKSWTGRRWVVTLSREGGGPTIAERRKAEEDERRSGIDQHPVVRAVMQRFPGAKVVAVRPIATTPAADAPMADPALDDLPPLDDEGLDGLFAGPDDDDRF